MNDQKIAFIGAGNMACSIIGGLLAKGYDQNAIRATARTPASVSKITAEYGVLANEDNASAAVWADIIVLGAKPQGFKSLCNSISTKVSHRPLIVSIAAGINCSSIRHWLGADLAIVRAMPNTPALVNAGATGLFANAEVSSTQQQNANNILCAVGITVWVETEDLINVVTAVSGSGPAYHFLFMEAMIDAGIQLGLNPADAQALTLQTASGASKLAQSSNIDIQKLRQNVTSPGGTTEQAIRSLENNNIRRVVEQAMQSCTNRARALASEFGDK